ncbi:MAG TPA: acyl-CoA dehydrogenase family protein [Streptosporangiaceae bacterium]|nr:acyl-CoA dehydrogenase family protein [Streptosporangiaceae bacterium]
MNFESSDAQNDIAGLLRDILSGREHLADGGFDAALWRDLGKAGVLSADSDIGLLEQCSVLVELGRAIAPVPYLPSIVMAASAVASFGTPEQQRRWAEPAGRGDLLLTAALAEDDAELPAIPSTTAAASGLSGVKTVVDGAPWADAFLVPAVTPEGVRVFVVERADPGVSVAVQELTDGVTAGRVMLDNVPLGADRQLGGPEVAGWLAARGTVGLCALQLGVTERALELTAEYARGRVQFGRPIGSFQAVAQRLADAWIDVEAIRLTMWQAAWRLAAGQPDDNAVATAKFWAADAGHRVAHTAVHVHGGIGIDSSYPLHRYFASAKHNEFALGGATTQLRNIGSELANA